MKGEKIFVSFSGGRTSAYMAKLVKDKFSADNEVVTVFANTGQEHEKTLEFVKRCDDEFGLNTVWVESVVHHGERKGCTHKVVDFNSACRSHNLFEEVIKKYGIPNMSFPHCTRELKTNPLHSYVRSLGWKTGDYYTAIGIRVDEIDRINPNYEKLKYWYPLANMKISKEMINDFWKSMPFNLEIPEHYGNCTWCWKKTIRKHMALIDECPEIYESPRYLEKYKDAGAGSGDRKFFRKNKTVKDLFSICESGEKTAFVDEYFNDCKESCEAFL